jgi:hypothetical protein
MQGPLSLASGLLADAGKAWCGIPAKLLCATDRVKPIVILKLSHEWITLQPSQVPDRSEPSALPAMLSMCMRMLPHASSMLALLYSRGGLDFGYKLGSACVITKLYIWVNMPL